MNSCRCGDIGPSAWRGKPMRGRDVAMGLVLALVVPVAFPPPAAATPPPAATGLTAADPTATGVGVDGAGNATSTVTLITGDRVSVSILADGHRTYSVRAARRAGGPP